MDSKLSFENHMHGKIGKANRILGVVRRSFLYLDDKTFLYLYKALIRPHLEFCNQVWSPHLRKHINSLENVQRRATRMLPQMKDLTYPE